jgi:hypothetical protein
MLTNKIVAILESTNYKVFSAASALIVALDCSDDINHIINSIKRHDFDTDVFFGYDEELNITWNNLLDATHNNEHKRIIKKYIVQEYDHNKEEYVGSWVIFCLLNGHKPIFGILKDLIYQKKTAEAKEVLLLHKKAVNLSQRIVSFKDHSSMLMNSDQGKEILFKAMGLIVYIYDVRKLDEFINGAENFLLESQREL